MTLAAAIGALTAAPVLGNENSENNVSSGAESNLLLRIPLSKRSNHEMIAEYLKKERDFLLSKLEGASELGTGFSDVADARKLRGGGTLGDGKDENVIIKDYANAQYYGTVHIGEPQQEFTVREKTNTSNSFFSICLFNV